MYKLSVIVPIYNSEKHLRCALDSIINQTMDLKDIEVIMVNDGSCDGSNQIMEEYNERYDNFISIHFNENTGSPSKPRNIGIETASSDYIMFLDSDDLLDKDACESLYNIMISEDADFVSGLITRQSHDNKSYIDVPCFVNIFDQSKNEYDVRKKSG